MFTVALFTVAKIWNQPTKVVFINKWMNKKDVYVCVYTQWNTNQPLKNWSFTICNNKNGLKVC